MGVDPRFVDHVVVTSSTTRIDTDRLVCAAVQMRGAAEGARAVGLRLHGAGSAALEGSAMAPLETAWAHGALAGAETAAVELAGELDGLADALGFAALVYLAAEGGAASFQRAWRLLRPDSAAGWDVGWGTLHTRERIRDAFPSPLRPYVPEGLLDVLAAPFLPATVGGVRSGLWHLDSFREGRMSDGADMMRVQLDIEALSALVADHTMEIPAGRGILSDGDAAAWWGDRNAKTPQAASIAAGWMSGIGRWRHGATGGVRVSMAVPADTLDARTGRPVGYRRSSTVRASDPPTPKAALTLMPGSLGVFSAVSVGGSHAAWARAPMRPSFEAPAGAPRSPTAVGTPAAPSELLERISGLGTSQEHGQFEILEHRTPDSDGGVRRSWSVVIRGTQGGGFGQSNPQDMLTNLQGVAGEPSDQQRAILEAMGRAGIAPDEPVELTGHSQGAIMAAQLAADPLVTSRFDVVSVLTAGGPTAGSAPTGDARLLALENTRDAVPALDGAANRDPAGSATVYFDGGLVDNPRAGLTAIGPHDLGVYSEAMSWLESGRGGDATAEVADWIAARRQAMGFTEETRTTSILVETRRVGRP
jgi:hypothetical protein